MESSKLWKLPASSTDLIDGPHLAELSKRHVRIWFRYDDDGETLNSEILFEGVEAFKCTYMTSVAVNLINVAYNKLVDMGKTTWLDDVMLINSEYIKHTGQNLPTLRHLAIYFDDGPCYEVVCKTFKIA